MSIDYFLPLSNPYQTSEERSFEEDIEMRVEDENEGFEDEEMIDEERGQLRNSSVEVAENHEKRIECKGKACNSSSDYEQYVCRKNPA